MQGILYTKFVLNCEISCKKDFPDYNLYCVFLTKIAVQHLCVLSYIVCVPCAGAGEAAHL